MQNDVEVQEIIARPLPMLADADQPPEASAAGDPMASATVNAMKIPRTRISLCRLASRFWKGRHSLKRLNVAGLHEQDASKLHKANPSSKRHRGIGHATHAPFFD
jgi:hypothetical protein